MSCSDLFNCHPPRARITRVSIAAPIAPIALAPFCIACNWTMASFDREASFRAPRAIAAHAFALVFSPPTTAFQYIYLANSAGPRAGRAGELFNLSAHDPTMLTAVARFLCCHHVCSSSCPRCFLNLSTAPAAVAGLACRMRNDAICSIITHVHFKSHADATETSRS